MLKFLSIALISSVYLLNANKELVVDDTGKMVSQVKNEPADSMTEIGSMWDKIEKMEADIKSSLKNLEEEFKNDIPSKKPDDVKVELKDSADNVVVTIGTSGIEGNLEVQAHKNNLNVSFATKSAHKIEFKVIDGKIIRISQKAESKKSEDKNGMKYQSMMASMSDQVETLPDEVGNLEQAKVDLAGNNVIIYLPKTGSKNGWKTIKVNKV